MDRHGPYEGDVNGLIDRIRERHRTIPFSAHHANNIFIEFSTPDVALVETYILSIQRCLMKRRRASCSSREARRAAQVPGST